MDRFQTFIVYEIRKNLHAQVELKVLQCYSVTVLQCYSVGVLLRRKMKAVGRSLMIGRCQFDLQSQILAYIL